MSYKNLKLTIDNIKKALHNNNYNYDHDLDQLYSIAKTFYSTSKYKIDEIVKVGENNDIGKINDILYYDNFNIIMYSVSKLRNNNKNFILSECDIYGKCNDRLYVIQGENNDSDVNFWLKEDNGKFIIVLSENEATRFNDPFKLSNLTNLPRIQDVTWGMRCINSL